MKSVEEMIMGLPRDEQLIVKRLRSLVLECLPQATDFMSRLFESGQMVPVIDGPYRLEDVPEAFRIFGRGEHKGKMVITVRPSAG